MRMLLASVVTVAAALVLPAVEAQQRPSLEFHDTALIQLTPFGPMQARAVLADTSGFAYAVMPAGMKQTPHHHDQEQFTIGIDGTFDMALGGTTQRLSHHAVLVPSNVEHPMTVGEQPATMMEFQPVLRPDWLPPHPRFVSPQSPAPLPLPAGATPVIDFGLDAEGWQSAPSGARSKAISGRTIRVTFHDLSAPGAVVHLGEGRSARERLVYVLGGRVAVGEGGPRREAGKATLVVVRAAAANVSLASTGQPATEAIVFEGIEAGPTNTIR